MFPPYENWKMLRIEFSWLLMVPSHGWWKANIKCAFYKANNLSQIKFPIFNDI